MKTSLEDKIKISAFTGIGAVVLSMTPLSGALSNAIGGQEAVVVGVMGFLGSLSGLFVMDMLNM